MVKTRKRLSAASGEESGEGVHRRSSLRKRPKTEYASKGGSEDRGDSSDFAEENESGSEEEHPGWPVTCGNKKGVLHIDKLGKGQDCIESDGCWFSPSAFEQFGGKGTSKKWKTTIVHNDYPLQFWIDNGHIRSPVKKHQSAASERLYNNESLPEESAENSHEEGEGPAQTEDAQEEVQHGERTNGILKGIESITSKKKPMLVLHKLEHLQGDFHLLLNDVVLPQKESSVPGEAAVENAAEDSFGTEESSESEVVTLPQDNPSENEDIILIEDSPTAAKKPESHHTKDESVQKNGSDFAPKEETEEKTGSRTEETTEPEDAKCENEGEAIDDAPSAAEELNVECKEANAEHDDDDIPMLENDEQPEEKIEDRLDTAESCDPREDANSENKEESMHTDNTPSAAAEPNVPKSPSTKAQDVDKSSPQENTNENIQNEMEIGAEVEIGAPQQPIKERPPKEDSRRTIMCDQAAKAQPGAELDVMDLQQLKKEKIKMQIKVLRLQAEYYSLQIKKLL